MGLTTPAGFGAYAFNERTKSLAGPIANEDITAVANRENSSEIYCVTADRKIKKTDLLDLNDASFPEFIDPFTDLVTPITEGVIASESGQGFHYRGLFRPAPFEDESTANTAISDPLYFPDSYLAITETHWMHLGDEHNEKQVHRVDLAFHKNSCGHLWLYVKNEAGKISGQYKGMLKEHMKVFTNIRGRRFKIQMLIATHKNFPWALREMTVGHLYGKSF